MSLIYYQSMYLDLFDELVRPILCYGAEVWGFSKINLQERIHLHFFKKVIVDKTNNAK